MRNGALPGGLAVGLDYLTQPVVSAYCTELEPLPPPLLNISRRECECPWNVLSESAAWVWGGAGRSPAPDLWTKLSHMCPVTAILTPLSVVGHAKDSLSSF